MKVLGYILGGLLIIGIIGSILNYVVNINKTVSVLQNENTQQNYNSLKESETRPFLENIGNENNIQEQMIRMYNEVNTLYTEANDLYSEIDEKIKVFIQQVDESNIDMQIYGQFVNEINLEIQKYVLMEKQYENIISEYGNFVIENNIQLAYITRILRPSSFLTFSIPRLGGQRVNISERLQRSQGVDIE